jgi:hypothetical protein
MKLDEVCPYFLRTETGTGIEHPDLECDFDTDTDFSGGRGNPFNE